MKIDRTKDEIVEDFMISLRQNILYWEDLPLLNEKEKLEGVTFSILVMLDGMSCSYDGNINLLAKSCKSIILHDHFYEKGNE